MRFRIRTIKPEYFRDEKIARLRIEVRYVMLGLISHADDEGRLDGSPAAIRSLVFPQDDLTVKRVDEWLELLAKSGRISRYSVDGFAYIEIRNWHHQKINRPTASRIPSHESVTGHVSLTDESVINP